MRLRIALLMLLTSMPGFSQVVAPEQVLDRVYSYNSGAVLNMNFGSLDTGSPFQSLNLQSPTSSSLNFVTCTVTAVGGLYCLDGQKVRRWKNALEPEISEVAFDCQTNLGSLPKGSGCVAMTVDLKGQIWLGVKKGNSHSVYKAVPNGTGSCTQVPFCVSEPYVGRPTIVDLVPVDGDLAENFHPCTGCAQSGVIGIEERKNAVFFPDAVGVQAQARVLVKAADWPLKPKELLQEITLLQLDGTSATGPVTSVLATTTLGRVLTRGTADIGMAREVLNLPAQRSTFPDQPASCPGTSAAQFGIRASATTGIVYVSDRNCFQVLAFTTSGDTSSGFSLLYFRQATTSLPPEESYDVIGVSIAPGVSINLANCSGSETGCTIVNGGPDNLPAASFLNVKLVDSNVSGATVFQIKGIPDCRQAPELSDELLAVCVAAGLGVVVDQNGNSVPIEQVDPNLAARLSLNVTPLLPNEVVLAFNASGLRQDGQLPQLLISRQYSAQSRNGYAFDAFFVLPQRGVRFQNTFNSEYEVGLLEDGGADENVCATPVPLIAWDVTTHVSEVNASVGGKYVDTLSNVGCGSIRGVSASMSLLPYNLQINPDTWNPDIGVTIGNDAVFARLLQNLLVELGDVQSRYACTGALDAPIDGARCGNLTTSWNNASFMIGKCIDAAFTPKSSTSNENCKSFVSQLSNYRSALPPTTPSQDVANRVGELKARVETIFHLYYDRFLPSMALALPNGFCRERSPENSTTCPSPW